ncbi:CehA/McbA family metallohydrolase domain-containing protein [Rossellomorea vietnamensis]|uniref:hypothetical protein n=1 Tax=Rossellomorea vietnamensis TaxID=218284 RepID=UPI001E33B078|nr:hypothetical protein [Rossellomorea vietnamensis]MCC5800780.1 hypothetical protein [Rossellomorea vietnamensis]
MTKNVLWSDFHSNLHPGRLDQLESWYDFAKEMLDFWALAYYPFHHRLSEKGLPLEDVIPEERRNADWEAIREFAKEKDGDGFPFYMGYEWQGNGEDGDHNVFYRHLDQSMTHPMTYKELCEDIPLGEAMAIPHHPGYAVGHRGKNWATHDERYSPFTEIFSSHGSSESDYDDIPLNVHIHMGPRDSKGTVMSGLNNGAVTGIICSGDNHVSSAITGNGFLGLWADDNHPDTIFNALLNRHVYGVTRSRIQLYYTLNDALMGSFIERNEDDRYMVNIDVEATNALDRIEVIRNGIVEATYTHNGKWEKDKIEGNVRFKFELEMGWGPDLRVYPDINEKIWKGSVQTTGKIHDVEKLWTSPGSKIIEHQDEKVDFEIVTRKGHAGNGKLSQKNHSTPYIQNQGMIFEIEADVNSTILIELDGKKYEYAVSDILKDSDLVGLIEDSKALGRERFEKDDFYRSDPFWHNAYKFKVHRGVPEKAYKVSYQFDLDGFEANEKDYVMVKVHQRNGEKAWSSPVWISNHK